MPELKKEYDVTSSQNLATFLSNLETKVNDELYRIVSTHVLDVGGNTLYAALLEKDVLEL